MNNEDLKVLTFRLEKAAFILGKTCGAVYDLLGTCPEGIVKEKLYNLSKCLELDCGELYYPKPCFVGMDFTEMRG